MNLSKSLAVPSFPHTFSNILFLESETPEFDNPTRLLIEDGEI